MNQTLPTDPALSGLEVQSSCAPAMAATAKPAPPRVKPVNRSQLTWAMMDVQTLIAQDHPARAIWSFVEQLNLEWFYRPIEAVAGVAGRTPWDPRLLVSLSQKSEGSDWNRRLRSWRKFVKPRAAPSKKPRPAPV